MLLKEFTNEIKRIKGELKKKMSKEGRAQWRGSKECKKGKWDGVMLNFISQLDWPQDTQIKYYFWVCCEGVSE